MPRERVALQPEVIRAIVLEDSPYLWGPEVVRAILSPCEGPNMARV